MNVAERLAVAAFALHEFCDLLVHFTRAETAPIGHDQRLVVEAELSARLRLVHVEEFLPDGRSGNDHALRACVLPAAVLKGDHDAVHRPLHHPGRQSGDGVGFMHSRRHPKPRAHFQRRKAGVAARADDHIRVEFPDDAPHLTHGAGHMQQRRHVVPDCRRGQLSLIIGDLQRFKPEVFQRDELVFHAVLRADEEDLAVRLSLPQHVRHGNSGIDMAPCTAAGKYDLHPAASQLRNRFLIQEIVVVLA